MPASPPSAAAGYLSRLAHRSEVDDEIPDDDLALFREEGGTPPDHPIDSLRPCAMVLARQAGGVHAVADGAAPEDQFGPVALRQRRPFA